MRVLFDTNVVLDVINRREPFLADAYKSLQIAFERYTACVSVTTITDVMYITRKAFADSTRQKHALSVFFSQFRICAVKKRQIRHAFASLMSDYEDAVQAFCAKHIHAAYVITRNIKDYRLSPVPAITPADFLAMQR
ncbi:MAG: PIN domain-containing protein [Treponema sp.]|nr:PIN domain-containing protein [Treponema sp.]